MASYRPISTVSGKLSVTTIADAHGYPLGALPSVNYSHPLERKTVVRHVSPPTSFTSLSGEVGPVHSFPPHRRMTFLGIRTAPGGK